MMTAITHSPLGFGAYLLPPGKTFSQMQGVEKVQKICLAILYASIAAASTALLSFSPFLAVGVTALFSILTLKTTWVAIGLFFRSPPTQELYPRRVEETVLPLEVNGPCAGFATRDGVESHQWKLSLIRSATRSLLISGCYCGGIAFDEVLDVIREQMRLHPLLTTSLLASSLFITAENRGRLEQLQAEFGSRFTSVLTSEIFPFLSPTSNLFSFSTNHTKALVVDYGASFLIGGSGMLTPWAQQRGLSAQEQIESHGLCYDHLIQAKAYRDMDFVFQSPPYGIGTRLHLEMTKLFERFRSPNGSPPLEPPLPLLPPPLPAPLYRASAALYATGPENAVPTFLNALIEAIEQAERSIVIAHMYFHPPPALLKALQEASNRGVKITLLTNKLGSQSPGSHLAYAELSRYYAKLLFEGKEKPHVEHYEYDVPYTTFHKKIVLIDRKTLFQGSSNIGKKSLETLDYEIDMKVESPELVRSIEQILEEDKRVCQKDPNPTISLKTHLLASLQTLLTQFL